MFDPNIHSGNGTKQEMEDRIRHYEDLGYEVVIWDSPKEWPGPWAIDLQKKMDE